MLNVRSSTFLQLVLGHRILSSCAVLLLPWYFLYEGNTFGLVFRSVLPFINFLNNPFSNIFIYRYNLLL